MKRLSATWRNVIAVLCWIAVLAGALEHEDLILGTSLPTESPKVTSNLLEHEKAAAWCAESIDSGTEGIFRTSLPHDSSIAQREVHAFWRWPTMTEARSLESWRLKVSDRLLEIVAGSVVLRL